MKFTALNKRIIAKNSVNQTPAENELYIPEAAKNAPNEAVVESVGSAVKDVKVGDHIIYEPQLVKKAQLKGEEYLIINEEDILAKVEE